MNNFSKNKDLYIINNFSSKKIGIRLTEFVLGCFIIALSYNVFIASNNLAPGGVGGIAVILNHLFQVDNANIIFILNAFLLVISYVVLGKEKTKRTILGTILFPIFVKLTEHANVWIQIDTSKVLLAALFGGIIYGFGAGLVFKAGFTTGGTDIINQILSKFLKISMGKSMLLSDGIIVISSAFFFGISSMMYSILVLYLISVISDKVVLGVSDNKMFYIISEKEEEIRNYIMSNLNNGVTILKAKGGYHKYKGDVIVTILPTRDYYTLRTGIKKIDKEAFFIVTDSYEVFGGE